MREIRISQGEDGPAEVVVAGVDVAKVVDRAVLELAPGQPPVLHLAIVAQRVDAELAAVLEHAAVTTVAPEDSREQVLVELAGMDPGDVEQAALARMGGLGDGPAATGAAFLAEIVERLR
jgi:hypothetical protein